jgi:hypothetical protein
MDKITWLDAIRATLPSCNSCFFTTTDDDEQQYGEDLRSLLDTVSLHSDIGQGRKRKMKKKEKKSVTLFGFSLFGARQGAIRLEEDQEERPRTNSQSSYGYESDAHVLAQDAIARVAEQEKIERRRKRRERREKRRIARALAAGGGDEDEFEGFQGSGGGQTYTKSSNPLSSTSSSTTRQSDRSTADDEDDDEEADLDAAMYTARPRPTGAGSSARSSTTGSSQLAPPHRRTSSHSQSQSSAESRSLASPPPPDLHLSTTGLQKQDDTSRFPSPGFGRGYSAGRGGAFLARTGADEDEM